MVALVVDATKDERAVANVELGESIDNVAREDIAFEARLIGTTLVHFEGSRQAFCKCASLLQTLVCVIEIGLLVGEFIERIVVDFAAPIRRDPNLGDFYCTCVPCPARAPTLVA